MFPGEDFSLIAWTLGGVFCGAILLLTYTIKRLLPETFLRLELLFLCNLLIALVGIVATVNGKTAVVGTDSTNFGALAGTLAFGCCGWHCGNVVATLAHQTANETVRITHTRCTKNI